MTLPKGVEHLETLWACSCGYQWFASAKEQPESCPKCGIVRLDLQVAKQLAEELGWCTDEDGTWYQYDEDFLTRPLPDMTRDALISREMRVRELEVLREGLLAWAVERWHVEVEHRPLVNVHRRTLDDTWRQVIRYAGGDPTELVGTDHDTRLALNSQGEKNV